MGPQFAHSACPQGSAKALARSQTIKLGAYVGHAAHDGQMLGRAFTLAQNAHGAGRLNAGPRGNRWTRAAGRRRPSPLRRCSACAAWACGWGRAARASQFDGVHHSGRRILRSMAAFVCRFPSEGTAERDKGQRQAREVVKRNLHVKLPWAMVEHRQDSK